jgi:WD40 repeat protein
MAFVLSISSCGQRGSGIESAWTKSEEILTLKGHTQDITRALYSPDGSLIITLSADSSARVWDGETGSEVAVLSGHTGTVRAAAFLPNVDQVRTYAEDHKIKTWDIQSNTEVSSVQIDGTEGRLVGLDFSPDGSLLVIGDRGRAEVYDATTGEHRYTLAPIGHPGLRVNTMDVCFRPDGARIVTAAYSQEIGVWDTRDGNGIFNLHGHGQGALSVAYSPDMSLIASGSRDQSVIIWDARLGAAVKELHPGWEVRSVAFNADGTTLLAIENVPRGEPAGASLWDVETGRRIASLDGIGRVRTESFHPLEHRFVAPSGSTANVYQAGTTKGLKIPAERELPSDLDALVHMAINDPVTRDRIRAAWRLAELSVWNEEVVPALKKHLRSSSPDIRLSATLVLAEIGAPARELVPILGKHQESEESAEIRTATALALGCISTGWGDTAAVLGLMAGARDEDARVRYHAAHAIGKMGASARKAFPELVRLVLTDPTFGIRRMVAFDLGNTGESALSALPELIEGSSSEDARERWWACYSIWSIAAGLGSRAQSAIPALKLAMTDPSDFRDENGGPPRKYAIHAMGAMGPVVLDVDPFVVVMLANIMEDDDDYYHRKAAALALQNILGVEGLRQQVRGYVRRPAQ